MNLLIAIEGCEAHWDRAPVIRDTWAQGSDKCNPIPHIRFFTGKELHVPDDYLSLPAKTKAICNIGRRWDFTCIVDTDAYVSLPRLLASPFSIHDYYGNVLEWIPNLRYCSGPTYWLSQKACEILAGADWSKYAVPNHATDEDVMVGAVLRAHGIFPFHDSRYVSSRPVAPDNDTVSYHMPYHSAYSHERMMELHRIAHQEK